MNRQLVALIAGGTAGHVNLALSVAEAIRRVAPDVDVLFIGAPNGVEATMLARTDWRFEAIPGRPFQRTGLIGKAGAVASAARGILEGRRLLRAKGVTYAIGFGAYASFGGTAAARSLGIPTAILEPNAEIGMANRVLRRWVDRVFVGWNECEIPIDPSRKNVCGVPVRDAFRKLRDVRHDPPASTGRPSRILIMAAAEESGRFNEISMSLVHALHDRGIAVEVRHQTGPSDVDAIRRAWSERGIDASTAERLDDIAAALAWADFVIARSGASTIAETAIAGRPALFIPLSRASEDHQSRNAALIASRGGALWSSESNCELETIVNQVADILTSAERWSNAAARMRAALDPDAGERIARDVLARVAR